MSDLSKKIVNGEAIENLAKGLNDKIQSDIKKIVPVSNDGKVPAGDPLFYIDNTEDLNFEFLVDELNDLKQNKNPQTPMVFFESDEILALENKEQLANATFEARINSKVLTGYATLKIQGSSSSVMPKKNYTVKFFKDKNMTEKYKMNVGWGENNKFCFKANYIDSSHTRNLSGARVARDMIVSRPNSAFKENLMKAPNFGHVDGFPIKVYINGDFHGIYTWNMPKDEKMLAMDEDNPNHICLCSDKNGGGQTEPTTCQFRVEWDYTGKLGNSAGSAHWMWKVEAGPDSQETADKLNRVIRFVKDTDDATFMRDFDQYLDLYSLIDYYCFSHLCCHCDGLGKNILFTTYDGLQWGTVLYDMDTIYGGWVSTSSENFWRPYDYACPQDYQEPNSLLWERLVKLYSKELKERYFELRKGALSLGNIITHVEEIYERVTDRMLEDEWAKWTEIPVKEENTMSRFRTYMSKRANYSDDYFKNL